MMILVESDGGQPLSVLRRPELILWAGQEKENTKVTIYHGTDCKLYDAVCEGELLGR